MISQSHLNPVVTGNERTALETIPLDVRNAAGSIRAKADRIARILSSPAAHPNVVKAAKDELKALHKEAGALWSRL